MASPEKLVAKAEKLVRQGKIEAAIGVYDQLLAKDPDATSAQNRMGDLYVRLGKLDVAFVIFSQIAERYARDGFLVKAVAINKKIVRLAKPSSPWSPTANERLAEIYQKQGLLAEARAYREAVVNHAAGVLDQAPARLFVYGALRRDRFYYHALGLASKASFQGLATLCGAQMYSLGCFPCVVLTWDRRHVVQGELFDVDDKSLADEIHEMEATAGFRGTMVETDAGPALTFVVDEVPEGAEVVLSGDWNEVFA